MSARPKCLRCGAGSEWIQGKVSAEAKSELASPHGSALDKPTQLQVQNALRILTAVMQRDDEIIFTGGDARTIETQDIVAASLVMVRDHLYRTQEAAALLVPNAALSEAAGKETPK